MIDQISIYTTQDKQTEIEVKFNQETVWLSQKQISSLFGTEVPAISKHIQNILKEGELEKTSTVSKMEIVQKEGKRLVKRNVDCYNLDFIISIGYRVNSGKATQFRQWATQRLKEYLVQGYAINEKRLMQKEMQVKHLKTGIQILSRAIEEKAGEEGNDWLIHYAKGLKLLDDYDHQQLDKLGNNRQVAVYPGKKAYQEIINQMKVNFDSDIFGLEKDKGFESAIAQIAQAFGDEDAYPSIEEKAAMLLYLITKNHAFTDGNKRIAAACFLLFLQENNILFDNKGVQIISNDAMASLTLFVAASRPEEMEIVKRLIISVLNRNQ